MSLPPLDKISADKLKRRAATASIVLALLLSGLKLFATITSGSLAVLSSMIDSISDVLGSAITFVAVKYSTRPATDHHRYGYGKAEAISALIQAFFVAGSGLFVLYDACVRFFHPRVLEETPLAIGIMGFSLLATFILIAYQKHVARLTQSQAINADSAHYVVDILTNSSIILSLTVVKFFEIYWFDTLTALIIALYLLYNAYQLLIEAFDVLLDRELSDDVRDNLSAIIQRHDFVKGFHDVRTHSLGNEYLFEIHLELDGRLSLYEAHQLSDKVEEAIIKEYPNAQVIIHQDPSGVSEDRLDAKLVK